MYLDSGLTNINVKRLFAKTNIPIDIKICFFFAEDNLKFTSIFYFSITDFKCSSVNSVSTIKTTRSPRKTLQRSNWCFTRPSIKSWRYFSDAILKGVYKGSFKVIYKSNKEFLFFVFVDFYCLLFFFIFFCRMYPVVIGNGRQLTKDTVICGYNIPKGVRTNRKTVTYVNL